MCAIFVCCTLLLLLLHRNKPGLLNFNSRVSVVGAGYIKLERDLPFNVSTAWKPTLYMFECE